MPRDASAQPTVWAPRWLRLRGLLRKEMLQIIRDPSSIALAIAMPLALLILFGYGVTLDARHIATAVVIDDHGPDAIRLAAIFEGSDYFDVQRIASLDEASKMLGTRKVACVVHVQNDFEARLRGGRDAPVQVLVDGVDANRGQLIAGYAAGAIGQFNAKRMRDAGAKPASGAVLQPRVWFNPELDSQDSLVPGLLALILTLTGVLLTALVFVRERERGTLEALLVTPIRPGEIMIAKIIPYFIIGMFGLVSTAVLGRLLFGVPLRGSVPVLFLASSLFMLASLGIGLMISVVAPSQMVASQMSMIVGFMPAFFLSGLLFDLLIQPAWTRMLSRIIPTTYYIDAAKTIFLAGDYWPVLRVDLAVLALMAAFLLTVVRLKIGKRLG